MKSDPKFTQKTLILWSAVILAYAAIFILTDPLIMIPRETRQDIYEEYTEAPSSDACWPEARNNLQDIAGQYELTERSVLRILRHGYRSGWGQLPCTWEVITD